MSNLPQYEILNPLLPVDLLIVLNGVTEAEYNSGIWLSSEENDHLHENLDGFDGVNWAITALIQEPLLSKPTAKDRDAHKGTLYSTIFGLKPSVILALGTDVLATLWPKDKLGKVQSITKAKAIDFDFQGIPVVVSMNPKVHYSYLKTDGYAGDDLTDEYNRAFEKCDQLISGEYTPLTCTYQCIDDPTAAEWFLQRRYNLGVNLMSFDTEDTQWWLKDNEKIKPHQWWDILEAHGVNPDSFPDQFGTWGRDTQLSWCSICWTVPGSDTHETYSLNPNIMTWEFLARLFHGATVIHWNGLTEIVSLKRFRNFDMCDPQHKITHYDGMIRAGTRDQSIGALGLKILASQIIGAPAWDVEYLRELEEARKSREEQCGLPIACIADVNVDTGRHYNACDSFYMHILVTKHYMQNKDGGLHPDCRAFEWLTNSLGFFSRMTWTGTCIDLDRLYNELEEKERLIAGLSTQLFDLYQIERAKEAIQSDVWNFRSPIAFQALVAVTYGSVHYQRDLTAAEQCLPKIQRDKIIQDIIKESLILPKWVLRTDKGNVSTSADAITFYATGGKEDFLTDGEYDESAYAYATEPWALLQELKEHSDDLLKYYTLLNYTSMLDGRFHVDYRIIKSARHETSTEGVGAVSGRTSTSPNDQNRAPKLKAIDVAPPGFEMAVIDMKGAEMRVIGETTGDEVFSEWARLGRDTHLEKASILWSLAEHREAEDFFLYRSREECARLDEPSDEQKPWRKKGKTLNFAGLYMQEAATFAGLINISEAEALDMAKRDRVMTPGIYKAQCELYQLMQRGEPAITKIFGRVRRAEGWQPTGMGPDEFLDLGVCQIEVNYDPTVGEWVSTSKIKKKHVNQNNMKLFRSIWNTWGAQADANDYVIVMGCYIDNLLRTGVIPEAEVQVCKFIHDSIVFNIRADVVDKWVPYLCTLMESTHLLPVPWSLPMSVSASTGQNMGGSKEPGGQIPYDWKARLN